MNKFKYISPGEMAVGQYIVIYKIKPIDKTVVTPFGEPVKYKEDIDVPFIQGVPFQILSVNLPLVMLSNVCQIPNIPEPVLWNTAKAEFIEVDEEYVNTYKKLSAPKFFRGNAQNTLEGDSAIQVSEPMPENNSALLEELRSIPTEIEIAFLRGVSVGRDLAVSDINEEWPWGFTDEEMEGHFPNIHILSPSTKRKALKKK